MYKSNVLIVQSATKTKKTKIGNDSGLIAIFYSIVPFHVHQVTSFYNARSST
jgi:hypothetical protein